ncbi:hypothetical protein LR48_Vigan11g012600 [Vigna angularis]|uniref:Uncharacterized protein n=1 Tax=Phaseolus angularis TaxID=3914 RepID=A0A0L9VQS3_PHAAN|nr:hypothetical protein LR48_Vigan11g012600 [Vigna angularis]
MKAATLWRRGLRLTGFGDEDGCASWWQFRWRRGWGYRFRSRTRREDGSGTRRVMELRWRDEGEDGVAIWAKVVLAVRDGT